MNSVTQRLIAISNKLLAELRRIGDAVGVLHTDSQQHIEAIRKTDNTAEKCHQTPPVIRPEPEIPEPAKYQQERANTEKKWLERSKVLLEVLTLVAVIVYAVYAKRQWKTMNKTYGEIQKQTSAAIEAAHAAKDSANLNRRMAEGTQAAVVSAEISVQYDSNAVYFLIRNFGHVAANEVTANIVVTKERLPDGKQIGEKISRSIGPLPLQPMTIGESEKGQIARTFPIPGFEWEAALQLKQTVVIEWNGSYEDGFGKKAPINGIGCQILWCKDFTFRNGRIEADSKTTIPCAEFDGKKIAQSRESRRKAEESAKKQ